MKKVFRGEKGSKVGGENIFFLTEATKEPLLKLLSMQFLERNVRNSHSKKKKKR